MLHNRTLFTLLLSLIASAGSASADIRFNFENCYNYRIAPLTAQVREVVRRGKNVGGIPQIPNESKEEIVNEKRDARNC